MMATIRTLWICRFRGSSPGDPPPPESSARRPQQGRALPPRTRVPPGGAARRPRQEPGARRHRRPSAPGWVTRGRVGDADARRLPVGAGDRVQGCLAHEPRCNDTSAPTAPEHRLSTGGGCAARALSTRPRPAVPARQLGPARRASRRRSPLGRGAGARSGRESAPPRRAQASVGGP
jgi:hypothetical protein